MYKIIRDRGTNIWNFIFLILCLNINIPINVPNPPPINEKNKSVASLILLFFIIANSLSSPINKNENILIIIKY